MRIYLILFCVVILTACAFERTADQAYKEGKYLESISLIIAYVEEKGEQKLDADDLTHFRQLVSDVMGHYENRLLTADRNDHNSRIESLVALLNMKSQLANRFFSQQVSFFNNKYDFFSLRKAIAEEYYLWGNAVTCESSSCYSMRADLYKKGLEYYKYNDIENLYQKANTKYMQVAANEFYNAGKYYAQFDSFKLAAENFAQAIEVYKPLGKYKDSEQLFITYDKKYRTREAKSYYEKAQTILQHANTRYSYREITRLLNQAAEIYQPYGNYQNAAILAKQYQQKGIIKIYLSPEYRNLASNVFTNQYYQFVNSTQQADIVIEITTKNYYQNTSPQSRIDSMSENLLEKTINIKGENDKIEKQDIYKTYYFNLETRTYSNEIQQNININVRGLYNYSHSENFLHNSIENQYVYTGDVPKKYRNYTSGQYLTREELYQYAYKQSESYISDILKNIYSYTEQL